MSRAPLLGAALLGCASEDFGRLTRPEPAPGLPNVLLVSIDTLRADALHHAGYARETSPALDRLAAQGATFTRVWAQAPSTSPTHASMFTGRLVHEHGVLGYEQHLDASWTTLAEHLRGAGYRTWAVTSSVRFHPDIQLDQGFERYAVNDSKRQGPRGDLSVGLALDELAAEPGAPFFGFVHLMDVHAPYAPPEPHRSRFLDGEPKVKPRKTVGYIRRNQGSPARTTPEELHDLRALYDGGVSYVDTRMDELLAAVDALPGPTIVMVTADHGEGFHENGYLGHSNVLWDEVVRVPWIVRAPGVAAGLTLDVPAQTVDLMPTLCGLLGLPTPEGLPGADLSAALRGGPAPGPRDLLLLSPSRWGVVRDTPDGLFKLIVPVSTGKPSLHQVGEGHRERSRVQDRQPALFADLQASLAHLDLRDPHRNSHARPELGQDELQALRELGYVD